MQNPSTGPFLSLSDSDCVWVTGGWREEAETETAACTTVASTVVQQVRAPVPCKAQ
jgi:hypothetical protein